MFETIAGFSTSRPKTVLLTWFLILSVFVSGLFLLGFRSDHRIFFSEEDALLIAHDNIEKTFSKNDNVLFVVSSENENDQVKMIEAVSETTEKAWYMPRIRRVDSVTNFQHSYAQGDTVIVESLKDEYKQVDEAYAAEIIETALNEPLIVNRIISENGEVMGLVATFNIPQAEKDAAIRLIVKHARQIKSEIEAEFSGVSIRLSGSLMMDNAFAEASEYDISVLTSIMLVLMLVLLGVIFRTFVGVIGTMLVIFMSIIIGMGGGGFLGIELSPPSLIAPNIILTLAIADCIHLIWGVYRNYGDLNKKQSIHLSIVENGRPIVLTSLTTAVGFLTLNFSDSPPFNHLGTIAAIGVVAAMFLALTFLPALLMILPMKFSEKKVRLAWLVDVFADFVIQHERRLLLFGAPLVVIIALFIFKNEINDLYINYFSEKIEFRRDTDFAADNLTGIYYIDYSLDSGTQQGISNPQYLQEVEDFANWFRSQPGVIHVFSIADVVKKLNRNFNSENQDFYRIPSEKELISQYIFMYEMSLPVGLDLKDRIDMGKSATRMSVVLGKLKTAEILGLEKNAAAWAKENTQHIGEPKGVGTTIMFSNIGMNNIESMLLGTFVGLLVISLILTFIFKSFKIGLVVTFTNLMPAFSALGAWGLIVGEVGLAVSVLAAMTLGIVVDDTIHFIERFLEGVRKKGLNSEEAVRYAFRFTGSALITTSLVLACGFFVLSFSSFQVNSWMGMMTTLTIIIALLIDFLLLPPLLMRIEGKNEKNDTIKSCTSYVS